MLKHQHVLKQQGFQSFPGIETTSVNLPEYQRLQDLNLQPLFSFLITKVY